MAETLRDMALRALDTVRPFIESPDTASALDLVSKLTTPEQSVMDIEALGVLADTIRVLILVEVGDRASKGAYT